MSLATTVSLPVVRGPVPLAKTLGTIDRLSGGRTVVAVDAGSSVGDYEAVGLDFGERWKRLDEAVQTMRALWREEEEEFSGRFYSTEGITLRPYPSQPLGPPIWIGSWGSDSGLRRVARLGDGWLASAYNTTPESFRDSRDRLRSHLVSFDKDPERFPNGLATMFCFITEDSSEAERVFTERFLPISNRPQEKLRERLAIGPAEDFVEKLIAYRDAGVQRVFIWPVGDEVRQLELFKERVAPRLMR